MDQPNAPEGTEVSVLTPKAAVTAPATEGRDGADSEERLLDPEAFFRTSQMTDQLRDTAKLLLRRSEPTAETVKQMAEAYTTLRSRLVDEINADLVAQTMQLTPEIKAEDATADQVVFGTAQLARWLDSIEAGPSYLLSRKVNAANAVEVAAKVDEVLQGDKAAKATRSASQTGSVGSYL